MQVIRKSLFEGDVLQIGLVEVLRCLRRGRHRITANACNRAEAASNGTGARVAEPWRSTDGRPSRPYQGRRHSDLAGVANPQL